MPWAAGRGYLGCGAGRGPGWGPWSSLRASSLSTSSCTERSILQPSGHGAHADTPLPPPLPGPARLTAPRVLRKVVGDSAAGACSEESHVPDRPPPAVTTHGGGGHCPRSATAGDLGLGVLGGARTDGPGVQEGAWGRMSVCVWCSVCCAVGSRWCVCVQRVCACGVWDSVSGMWRVSSGCHGRAELVGGVMKLILARTRHPFWTSPQPAPA